VLGLEALLLIDGRRARLQPACPTAKMFDMQKMILHDAVLEPLEG
jgi:hypothetical protein